MVSSLSAPFRFPRWEIEKLQERGFYLDADLTRADGWRTADTNSTIALVFKKRNASAGGDLYMEIVLGRCVSAGTHWASVAFHAGGRPEATRSFVHSCPGDHASEWRHGIRTFEAPQGRGEEGSDWRDAVSLSLTPCPMNPTQTRIVQVSFVGQDMADIIQ